jgi:hypothetical protein
MDTDSRYVSLRLRVLNAVREPRANGYANNAPNKIAATTPTTLPMFTFAVNERSTRIGRMETRLRRCQPPDSKRDRRHAPTTAVTTWQSLTHRKLMPVS